MPATHDELTLDAQPPLIDSDQDAEGEEDTDLYQMDQQLQNAVQMADADDEAGRVDASSPEPMPEDNKSYEESLGDNEDEVSAASEDEEVVQAPRLRRRQRRSGAASDSDANDPDLDAPFENGSDRQSSSDESDVEAEDWEVESNEKDDLEADKGPRGNCM